MFSQEERAIYRKPPVIEAICQMRFPAILSISAKEPADFQEKIRFDYPKYEKKLEKMLPQLPGVPGAFPIKPQDATVNHQFLSEDGAWKVNLTNTFISLSTPRYSTWENFAKQLDSILVAFIHAYQPAYFERVGLRYINAISRRDLELEGTPLSELITPGYLGVLADSDAQESAFIRAFQDMEMILPGGCRAKIHSGLGMMQKNGVKDTEPKYIIDNDVYMIGKVEMAHVTGALSTVHIHADRIFRGQITEALHDAMEPFGT